MGEMSCCKTTVVVKQVENVDEVVDRRQYAKSPEEGEIAGHLRSIPIAECDMRERMLLQLPSIGKSPFGRHRDSLQVDMHGIDEMTGTRTS
jgi:hypothetical protein